jgi:sulfur relay (sulfurtransferase) complex TusBCD TusD component (DsrE family)
MLSLPAQAAPPVKKQTIVVHLSNFTSDLHAAMMAITIAKALQKKGAKVTLFLDVEGVRAGDLRQPHNLTWGNRKNPTFGEQYWAFVRAGGKVVLCPHCAEAIGMKKKDLRKGAKMGTEKEIMNLLLAADKVIDY